VTTVLLRSSDELQAAPALATLSALSACIEAFVAALELAHPYLLSARSPASDREDAARLLHMHLDACQHLLHQYDQLTFDMTDWDHPDSDDEHEQHNDLDDDIPF
jgi:hypothetical protein